MSGPREELQLVRGLLGESGKTSYNASRVVERSGGGGWAWRGATTADREPVMAEDGLSHFDERGASRMVDVGAKPESHRVARAAGRITMRPETRQRILDRGFAKGDVLEVARLAGVMAAKRTADLIPLCHPLALTAVRLDFEPVGADELMVEAVVETIGRTGVEMEALTAVTVAALTVYDMCKSIDRDMRLGPFQLEEKSGGRSGYVRGPGDRAGQRTGELTGDRPTGVRAVDLGE